MSQKFVIVDLGNSFYDFNVYPVIGDLYDRKNGAFEAMIATSNGKTRNVLIKPEDIFDTYEDAFKSVEIAFIRFGQKLASDIQKRFERNRKFCKEYSEKPKDVISEREIFKTLKAKIYKSPSASYSASPYWTSNASTVNTPIGQNYAPDGVVTSTTTIEALQQQNIEIEAAETAQAAQVAEFQDTIQTLANVLQNTPEV